MSSTATTGNVRNAGIAFGGLVAGVAAVASYSHMRELAAHHSAYGMEWLSWLTPLSVDGLMVVASIVAVQARKRSEPVPGLAILAIVVALGISLIANFSAPAADIVGQAINTWPAAAFAFGYELVLQLIRMEVKPRAARKAEKSPKTAPTGAVPSPAPAGASSSEAPRPRAAVADATANAAPAVGASLRVVDGGGETTPIAGAPDWLTDDLRAAPRAAMLAYLDQHGDTAGAELDRFGAQYLNTKPSLGRKVRAEWLKTNAQQASGE